MRSRLITNGLAALTVGWLVSPVTVPLYDGVGFPDEPYRYVGQGAGKPAGTATAQTRIDPATGTNAGGFILASDESGPQVTVYVPAGQVAPSAGTSTVTVTATPVAPGQQPADGRVTGNAYRVTASAALSPAVPGTVILRAPVGFTRLPVMELRAGPGQPWTRLATRKVGNDIFQAPLTTVGDYAMVLPTRGASTGSGPTTLLVAGGGAAVLLLLIAVRVGRRRRRAPTEAVGALS